MIVTAMCVICQLLKIKLSPATDDIQHEARTIYAICLPAPQVAPFFLTCLIRLDAVSRHRILGLASSPSDDIMLLLLACEIEIEIEGFHI